MTAAMPSPLGGERGLPLLAAGVGLVFAVLAAGSPHRAAYAVAGVVAVVVVIRSLLAGLALFVILTFPEKLPGALGVGPTLAKPLGIVLVISWLLVILGDRERQVPFLPRDAPVLSSLLGGLLLWSLASAIWASSRTQVLDHVSRLAQLVALMLIAYSVVRTPRHLLVLVWAYLVGAVISSSYVLANGTLRAGRLTGGVFNPNFFAAELSVALMLATFLLVATRRLFVRVLLLACVLILAVAFLETQSRSGLLALAAAALTGILVAGSLRGRFVAVVLVAAAVGLTYYVYAASPQLRARISSIATGGQASPLRQDTWQIALRMSRAHPLQGVGLGNFPVIEPNYEIANLNVSGVGTIRRFQLGVHNAYLEVFAELGLVGLALFIGVLALTVGRALVTVLQYGREQATGVLAGAIVAGLVGLLTAQIFNSFEYSKQLWLVFGMAVAATSLLRQLSPSPSFARATRAPGLGDVQPT